MVYRQRLTEIQPDFVAIGSDSPRAAECAAFPTPEPTTDPDLAAVMHAWPTLPPESRQRILTIITEATPGLGSPEEIQRHGD